MHHQGALRRPGRRPKPGRPWQKGTKRSLAVEAGGIPLGVLAAPANRRDHSLLAATMDTLAPLGSLPEQPKPTVQLDAGYDYQPCRDALAVRGMVGQIASRGVPTPIQVGRRRVVERAHAWLNAFGKLRWCTERRHGCMASWLALACVIVIIRRLVRRAWTHYRWDARPRRRP